MGYPCPSYVITPSTDIDISVGVRKFSRVETGMGVAFRP